ncbi:MAG: WXG100 family type VII secretion target [Chloroflexota bacterium]
MCESLRILPTGVHTNADRLAALNEQARQMQDTLAHAWSRLDSGWEDYAESGIQGCYHETMCEIKRTIAMLEQMTQALKQSADGLEAADKKLVASFGTLTVEQVGGSSGKPPQYEGPVKLPYFTTWPPESWPDVDTPDIFGPYDPVDQTPQNFVVSPEQRDEFVEGARKARDSIGILRKWMQTLIILGDGTSSVLIGLLAFLYPPLALLIPEAAAAGYALGELLILDQYDLDMQNLDDMQNDIHSFPNDCNVTVSIDYETVKLELPGFTMPVELTLQVITMSGDNGMSYEYRSSFCPSNQRLVENYLSSLITGSNP